MFSEYCTVALVATKVEEPRAHPCKARSGRVRRRGIGLSDDDFVVGRLTVQLQVALAKTLYLLDWWIRHSRILVGAG
jgi:hypothetical protein